MSINFIKIIAVIFFLCGCEQKIRDQDVPEEVKNKLNTLYPDAGNVQWDKDLKYYKAYFINSGKNVSVLFDKKGNVKKTEKKIEENEIPEVVMKTIHREYPEAKLISFSRVDSRDMTEYTAKMHIKTEDYKVYFSQEGRLIRQMLSTKE
jgi:hypothetical protein